LTTKLSVDFLSEFADVTSVAQVPQRLFGAIEEIEGKLSLVHLVITSDSLHKIPVEIRPAEKAGNMLV